MTARAGVAALCIAVASAVGVQAAAAQGGDGYLFKAPQISVKFESGYGFQRASSDLFDFVIDKHTIEQRDFDSPYFGGELGVRLTEHWDLALSVGYQSSRTVSEYRDFIGSDDLPIEQSTELRQIPAVASLKFYPWERGRTLGRFAWVPRAVTPYVGGGVGFVSYRFEQDGEFVDEDTLDIFYDTLVSTGEGFLGRAVAGMDISLGSQFLFTIEGRYSWASSQVSGGYSGFDRIDLDGLQVIGGLGIRF